ncbi:protein of unknown function [Streptomyces murinus]
MGHDEPPVVWVTARVPYVPIVRYATDNPIRPGLLPQGKVGHSFVLTSQFKLPNRRGACGRRARHGRGPRAQGTTGVGLSGRHPRRGTRLADRDRGTVRLRPYVSAARAHRTDEVQ